MQTLSRLNRCHEDKKDVVVVDFTNNAAAILKAFRKYRKGTPFVPEEPDKDLCPRLYDYADRKQEHFLCATVNGANEILNVRVISIGLIDRSPVHPREVFADAAADRASGIIVAHNRPAGLLDPSPGDVEVNRQLKHAGEVVGIELLDHIIFNRTAYFSFLENGKLTESG